MRSRTTTTAVLLAALTALLPAATAQAAPTSTPPATPAYSATTSPEAARLGLALTVDPTTGQWHIQQAGKPGSPSINYPVSYCTGNFTGPRMIGTYTLDFGGEQTCNNAQDWPHRIIVQLQSTCSDWWCVVFQDEGEIDSGYRMSRIANAYGGLGCDNTDKRKYRLVADVYARSAYIGAAVGSYEPVLKCSM